MNIKLLTFDLDHTLWAPEEALKRAEEKMHAWLNKYHPKVTQLYSPQAFLKYRLQLAARQPQLAVQVSAMRTEVLRLVCLEAGMSNEQATTVAKQAFAVFYHERSQLEFYPNALDTVKQLARRNPLISLTNGNADLKLIGVDQLFEAYFSADNIGTAKPAPEMFVAALKYADVTAEHCVHIGDCPVNDVLAPKRLGMKAVWVNAKQEAWQSTEHQPDAVITHVRELPALLDQWQSLG